MTVKAVFVPADLDSPAVEVEVDTDTLSPFPPAQFGTSNFVGRAPGQDIALWITSPQKTPDAVYNWRASEMMVRYWTWVGKVMGDVYFTGIDPLNTGQFRDIHPKVARVLLDA